MKKYILITKSFKFPVAELISNVSAFGSEFLENHKMLDEFLDREFVTFNEGDIFDSKIDEIHNEKVVQIFYITSSQQIGRVSHHEVVAFFLPSKYFENIDFNLTKLSEYYGI